MEHGWCVKTCGWWGKREVLKDREKKLEVRGYLGKRHLRKKIMEECLDSEVSLLQSETR